MLEDWSPDTDLGLIAYGHRRDGDCSDIEVLMTPQPVAGGDFLSTVNGLNPRGKTPISDAVILAAEELGYTDAKSTVILLTDGLETCERDPCEVARLLETRGIDFTAHVIAFDVAEEDREALACLAHETGGLYLQASDMEDLSGALQEVSAVATAEAVDEIVYDLTPATIFVPQFVVVGHPFLAEWSGPKNAGDWLHIRDPESGTSHAGTPVGPEDVGSPVEILAPAEVGVYEIYYEVAVDLPPLGSAVVNVVTVLPSVIVPDSVPAGSDFEVHWTGPASNGDRLKLIDPATGETLTSGTANLDDEGVTVLRAPEDIGTFEVQLIADSSLVLASASFVTDPVSASITLSEGPYIAGARAMRVEWVGPRNDGDRIKTYPIGEDSYIAQRPVSGNAQSPISVRIPREPGMYVLRLEGVQGTIYAEQEFEVLPEQ